MRSPHPADTDFGLVAVVLNARCAQARQAVPVDGALPRQKLIDRQFVALAGFLEAEQPAAHGCDDLGLAPNDPTLGILGRQVSDGQRTAVGPDDVAHARPVLLVGHDTRYSQLFYCTSP